MDVYEAIARRQTIRDFAARPVPAEIVHKLLDAGLKAPSNDHLRRWEFVLVQERARREELVRQISAPRTPEGARQVVDEWGLTDPLQREMYIQGIARQYAMILNAGCLIVPCFYYPGDLLRPDSLSALNGLASIWCCVENILVAAAAEGIFGVVRIPFEEERAFMKRFLCLPEHYEIPCSIALGYPAENASRARQVEIRLEDRLHQEQW
ncbi:MAG: nitroreductase family protein [Chloroflexi bacterium]|nr:nitroreductase family protein [Anaerolineaceae bacterium]NMB88878.1 nitroreductase family protein [Chloroflexota bacterium]